MQTKKTAIIIGGGVIGCGIALELLKRGYQTINIDRNAEVGFGSTVSSCAIVRFSYSTLDSVKLALEGYHYWKNWPLVLGVADPRGYARFIQTGHLVLKTRASDRAGMLELYRKAGVRFEEWSVEQLRERLPIYDTASFYPPKPIDDPSFLEPPEKQLAGAIYCPDGGYVNDPQLATHNLRCSIEARRGQFLLKQEVVDILRHNGCVSGVRLADGRELQADVVVNAAGPHSVVINRMAGVEQSMKVSTRALRREVHHLPSPAGFDFNARGICTSDPDLGIYWRPETGNKISVGSGDPPCDPKTWVDDPGEFDRDIREKQWQTQVYRLGHRLPELPIPNQAQGVVDLYDVSSDWIPIYDKSALPGFYMAIGSSGHQFKNAGVAGALMAELIDYQESGGDHDAKPLQFKGRFTGLTIDTAEFSRLREINQASSFSVRG
ncbi:MAG TPA: FAD-dependent oxidoreductase [Steroidobacteraceae bacterium]